MIPKHFGRDCELSTTGIDGLGNPVDPGRVTREILRQLPTACAERGLSVYSEGSRFASYSMDCCRNWTSNGQCHYADMAHHEVCTPTCLDPFDFQAHSWSMVQIAEEARRLAETTSDEPVNYSLSTSNVDGVDPATSFGTHLSVCVEQDLWEDLFHSTLRPSRLAMVASGLAAAIPFFGAGYLLPLKDRAIYSLSARAHHITRVSSVSTTEAFRRGMLNSRREPHGTGFDRLHIIGFDFCLLSGALLCSFVQCLLAAAEEKFASMQLLEPVSAMHGWSWGLDLKTGSMPRRAMLVDGRQLRLPEYMQELTQILLRMCESGLIGPEVAPRATELLPRIVDLAEQVAAGSLEGCARHLTWASKLFYLLNLSADEGIVLGDAATRLADHDFTNTDRNRGVIWRLWEEGLVDPLVTAGDVERAWLTAPENSRDAVRGRIIERFSGAISDVDWSYVELRETDDCWGPRLRIDLPQFDRAFTASIDECVAQATSVQQLEQHIERLNVASIRSPLDDVSRDLVVPGASRPGSTHEA